MGVMEEFFDKCMDKKKVYDIAINGMKSIMSFLNSEKFPRIRVGIGKPKEHTDMIHHVIGPIPESEKDQLNQGAEKAKDALIELIKNGLDSAMNKYN